jgi:hypothetical protein
VHFGSFLVASTCMLHVLSLSTSLDHAASKHGAHCSRLTSRLLCTFMYLIPSLYTPGIP